jgi:hypothetical protein
VGILDESLARFDGLRRIATEENYELPEVPRASAGRPNAFATVLDEWEKAAASGPAA